MAEELLAGIVVIWLVVCAASDLKSRTVPNVLTILPLTGALVLAVVRGCWPAAALLILLIGISDLPRPVAQGVSVIALISCAVLTVALGMPLEVILVSVMVFVAWLLWLYELTGGADAKILMTLTLLYGSPVFLAATLAGGVFGLVALLFRKRTLPYVLPILAGTVAYFVLRYVQVI